MSYSVRSSTPSPLFGRISLTARNFAAGWNRVGRQTQFYIATLRSTTDAVVNYQVELLRLIAQMALGTGGLILIGGTVVIVSFLMLSSGALVALQGYNALASEGVDALVDCSVSCRGSTGVEMEALTGASIAALTIYDMCKAMSHDIVIAEVRLLTKTGGKSDLDFTTRRGV